MKAITYSKYGPPEVLQLKNLDKPVPKDNEVLIRVIATTVTRGDSRMRGFIVPTSLWIPSRLFLGIFRPRRQVLGMELSGEIEAVGKKVNNFNVGDKVFASTFHRFQFGAYAEYICIPEDGMIALKPENISFEEAAPIPSGGMAAYLFLKKANIHKNQHVLINGASGTLGTFGIQIAKYHGARVTGVCSSKNFQMVKLLGVENVIDYTKKDIEKMEDRFDVIFDTIGNISKQVGNKLLAPNGTFISIRGDHSKPHIDDLFFLKALTEMGKIKPVIDRVYPFEQMIEAHRYVDAGHKKGNVVITV